MGASLPRRPLTDHARQTKLTPSHRAEVLSFDGRGKSARVASESHEPSRYSSARTSGSQQSTGRSIDGFTRISPLSYPTDPLVPFIIFYPNQTRRWCAAQTVRMSVDGTVCSAACIRLGQASIGPHEGDGGQPHRQVRSASGKLVNSWGNQISNLPDLIGTSLATVQRKPNILRCGEDRYRDRSSLAAE
jgi:hypothetical protein